MAAAAVWPLQQVAVVGQNLMFRDAIEEPSLGDVCDLGEPLAALRIAQDHLAAKV